MKFFYLLTMILCTLYLSFILRKCIGVDYQGACTKICDIKGRRLASVNPSAVINVCNCGAKIWVRDMKRR